MAGSHQVKHMPMPTDLEILSLSIYPKAMEIYFHRKISTRMSIAALLMNSVKALLITQMTINRTMGEQIVVYSYNWMLLSHINTTNYWYRNNMDESQKIMLSEPVRMRTHYMISFMWSSSPCGRNQTIVAYGGWNDWKGHGGIF